MQNVTKKLIFPQILTNLLNPLFIHYTICHILLDFFFLMGAANPWKYLKEVGKEYK